MQNASNVHMYASSEKMRFKYGLDHPFFRAQHEGLCEIVRQRCTVLHTRLELLPTTLHIRKEITLSNITVN